MKNCDEKSSGNFYFPFFISLSCVSLLSPGTMKIQLIVWIHRERMCLLEAGRKHFQTLVFKWFPKTLQWTLKFINFWYIVFWLLLRSRVRKIFISLLNRQSKPNVSWGHQNVCNSTWCCSWWKCGLPQNVIRKVKFKRCMLFGS